MLLGLAAVAIFAGTLLASTRVRQGRPVVIGGWRHPIDAIGVRFRDLPVWRRVALTLLVFPLVFGIFVIYQVRRLILGPPAE
jgi:hypothetical protein